MLESPHSPRTRPLAAARREAVERAEAYVLAHPERRVPLNLVCRLVGLSERGLRNAFYDVRGMSPRRCLLSVRLERVRTALSDREAGGPTTVTSVANLHGFYELGRFAA